jgi:hypothetical protein
MYIIPATSVLMTLAIIANGLKTAITDQHILSSSLSSLVSSSFSSYWQFLLKSNGQ